MTSQDPQTSSEFTRAILEEEQMLTAINTENADVLLAVMQREAARVSTIADLAERKRALGNVSRLAIDVAEELSRVEEETRLAAIGALNPKRDAA